MLKISILEFILRTLPESCILILAGYVFSKRKIHKKNFCLSSMVLATVTYLVRILPIHFGVHTIILIMAYILVCVWINNIDTIKAISAVLVSASMLFVFEGINFYLLVNLFKIKTEIAFNKPILKILYLYPSLILFGIVIFLAYKKLRLRGDTNDVFN